MTQRYSPHESHCPLQVNIQDAKQIYRTPLEIKREDHNTTPRRTSRQEKDFPFLVYHSSFIALLVYLILVCLAFPGYAEWNAPNFIVIPKDPWKSMADGNNGVIPEDSSFPAPKFLGALATPKSIAAGKALTEAAAIYAQIGLKEPIFTPQWKDDTRGAFIFPFPGTAELTGAVGEYISATCDDKKRFKEDWLALDSNQSGNELYVTAAHELFHAIQAQYPYSKNSSRKKRCKSIGWLDEGTADAAAYFLLERKLGGPLPNDLGSYGLRPYDVPLYRHNSWYNQSVMNRFNISESKEAIETFSYRTSSFWRFLMDRFDNIPRLSPARLKLLGNLMSFAAPANTDLTWLDWTARRVHGVWGQDFSVVYAQFLSEFASWPGSKYPNLIAKTWFELGFGGCKKVTLTPSKTSIKPAIVLSPRVDSSHALPPISGRCLQVTVKGFKGKKVHLRVEAEVEPTQEEDVNGNMRIETSAQALVDQLRLGLAREERGQGDNNKLIASCYQIARKKPNDQFPCALFGKITPKKSNAVHSWRTEEWKVKHSTFTRTYILSNVAPKKASKTKGIPKVDIRIGIRVFNGKTKKWTKFDPPEAFNLGQLPNPNIPRRQALYGIRKDSGTATGYPMNLAPLQIAALDDAGNKTETYTLSPMERVAFGQTGPLKAMVMTGAGGLPAGVIGSQFCKPNTSTGIIGQITRSDDIALEISIDTPLCKLTISNLAECQNGCPVVDHIQGEISLPFGWRHFAENPVEDAITPGVLIDIDRYHHRVFGTPLQGLDDLDGGGETGEGNPGGGSGSGNSAIDGPPPCDCSCETYQKIKNIKKKKVPDFAFLGTIMRCARQCAEPFRACRRAQKKQR